MSKLPKISVIIPVYNVKKYLNACVESIVSQDYKEFEIILIDDGSTDGSSEICDYYSNKYPYVITKHKKNGGQSSARNLGTKFLTGEYFIFVDSDDYISKNALSDLANEIIKYNNELDLVLTDGIFDVDNDGVIIKDEPEWNYKDYPGISGKAAMKKMLRNANTWSPCGKCYKTAFWLNNNFVFTEGKIAEDFELIGRVVIAAEKVSMIPGFYYYRYNIPSSTMHRDFKKLISDTTDALESWKKYLDNNKSLDEELTLLLKNGLAGTYEHIVLGNIFYLKSNDRKEILKKAKGQDYLFGCRINKEGRIIYNFEKIFGFNLTCFLLNVVKRYRKGEILRFIKKRES